MKSKSEMGDELNEILELSIGWEKLNLKELQDLLETISQPTFVGLLRIRRLKLKKRVRGLGFFERLRKLRNAE